MFLNRLEELHAFFAWHSKNCLLSQLGQLFVGKEKQKAVAMRFKFLCKKAEQMGDLLFIVIQLIININTHLFTGSWFMSAGNSFDANDTKNSYVLGKNRVNICNGTFFTHFSRRFCFFLFNIFTMLWVEGSSNLFVSLFLFKKYNLLCFIQRARPRVNDMAIKRASVCVSRGL